MSSCHGCSFSGAWRSHMPGIWGHPRRSLMDRGCRVLWFTYCQLSFLSWTTLHCELKSVIVRLVDCFLTTWLVDILVITTFVVFDNAPDEDILYDSFLCQRDVGDCVPIAWSSNGGRVAKVAKLRPNLQDTTRSAVRQFQLEGLNIRWFVLPVK